MKAFVFSVMVCMVMVGPFVKMCSAGGVFGKSTSDSSDIQGSPVLKVKNETNVKLKITTIIRGIGIERFIAPNGGEYVCDITNCTVSYKVESEDGRDLAHRSSVEPYTSQCVSIKKNSDGKLFSEIDKKSSQGSLTITS